MEINAFLAAIFFYAFPIFIGRPIVMLLSKNSLPLPFISYFLAGLFTLFITSAISYFIASALFHVPFLLVLQTVIGALSFVLIPANLLVSKEDLHIKPYILPLLVSVGVGFITYALFILKSPYPLNWDLYEHQTLAVNILAGRFSLLPSQITDTFGFNGYSTIFHTLLASSQAFLNVSVYSYWHILALFHLIAVIFASFMLGKTVSGKNAVGYLSAILGGIIFDSTISFTNLFLIPQTFTAVIFIFLFTQFLISIKRGQFLHMSVVILSTLAILLNHYIMGAVAAALYIGTYLYFKYQAQIEAKIGGKRLIEVGLFLALIGILFSSFIPLGFINKGEAVAFTLTFSDKFQAMRQSYGFLLILLLPLGFSSILKRKDKIETFIAVITVFLVSGILMQLPYVMKFFVLAKFFVGVILAIGIYTLISKIKNPVLYYASYVALTIGLFTLFITNITLWKGILQYENTSSHVSQYEIEAAKLLQEKYKNKNVLLISDPATQHILEPLSSLNTQGGAYMDIPSREKLSRLPNSNSTETAEIVTQIHDLITSEPETRLLILGGRYFEWQKASQTQKLDLSYNVWYPTDLSLEDIEKINGLLESDHFKLVYQNPGMTIVEVRK